MGINDSGQVVGSWTDMAGGHHGFIATPVGTVPEPRSLPVLAGCLCVCFALGCRWKRA
jgi:hypothetical protein